MPIRSPPDLSYAADVPILILAVLVVLAIIALIPVSLVQRFRLGTRRRPARRWIVTINLLGVLLSAALFVITALVTSRWVPGTLTYTLAGLAAGAVLGILGTLLTRWEFEGNRVYYTPNRWLVLAVTLVVTVRVLYGFWRTWEAWRASLERMTWVVASGIPASMSAGAIVLGYYLAYWIGVRYRLGRRPR